MCGRPRSATTGSLLVLPPFSLLLERFEIARQLLARLIGTRLAVAVGDRGVGERRSLFPLLAAQAFPNHLNVSPGIPTRIPLHKSTPVGTRWDMPLRLLPITVFPFLCINIFDTKDGGRWEGDRTAPSA